MGLKKLIEKTREAIGQFDGSQYPLPVNTALFGEVPDIDEVKDKAKRLVEVDLRNEEEPPGEKVIEHILLSALSLAEAVESTMDDRGDYFIPDAKFRIQVFNIKRSPGWVLVLGDADQTELINGLKEKRFTVYSTFKHPKAIFLGGRDTSSIYFLQNQVRYAMIYGKVEPGDPHSIGHFLEEDGPGILIVNGRQSEVESLLTLGYMLMGTPAIVPTSFPFAYGNRVIVDSVEEILDRCMGFQNLRIIEHEGSKIQLPEYCDPANLREEVDAVMTWGGTEESFFVVRRREVDDVIEVIGQPSQNLGIIIELDYPGMNDVAEELLEEVASRFPNYIKGVKATLNKSLKVEMAEGVNISGEQLADTIHAGLKKEYLKLDRLKVTVIFDEVLLGENRHEIDIYRSERKAAIAALSEESIEEFYSCVGCQPFAREHACVVTPERHPQCGRDWRLMVVGAYLNPEDAPDPLSRKRTRVSPNAFGVLRKGEVLDKEMGEWSGVNEDISRETGGRIERVQIHSITGGYPHSSCGCFGYIVFQMPDLDGIGVMKKGFKGRAPNGMTWDTLANMAGGKQEPGICGISLNYLRSAKFLKGDGGFKKVVWMDDRTRGELEDML